MQNYLLFLETKIVSKFFITISNHKLFHRRNRKILFIRDKRWDLETIENQTIKLPVKDYKESLKNFLSIKNQDKFKKYKIFDYRIKDQLILK